MRTAACLFLSPVQMALSLFLSKSTAKEPEEEQNCSTLFCSLSQRKRVSTHHKRSSRNSLESKSWFPRKPEGWFKLLWLVLA